MKLAGKVLVVTGAGSGIGRAVALEAVRRRARVAAVDLNATTLEETATLVDGAVSTHPLNVTDRVAVEALPAQVIAQLGVVGRGRAGRTGPRPLQWSKLTRRLAATFPPGSRNDATASVGVEVHQRFLNVRGRPSTGSLPGHVSRTIVLN